MSRRKEKTSAPHGAEAAEAFREVPPAAGENGSAPPSSPFEPGGPRAETRAAPMAEPPAGEADPGEGAKNQAAIYLDQLQRSQAEFDNYRKRVRREQEEWFRSAKAELLTLFLPILDDLRRARQHASPDSPPDAAGLLLILRRFEDALTKAGLEEQQAKPGTEFNPELHEALLTVPSGELPEGAITEVLEPGYLFEGRLIRRGKVACSSGPQPE